MDCATTRQSSQGDSGVAGRVLSQFLAEMDGIEELSGVFVLAATNRPDMVDPALRRFGRFEQTIQLTLPDIESRRMILSVHLKNRPLAEEIDIDALAMSTDGLSEVLTWPPFAALPRDQASVALLNPLQPVSQ